MNRIEKIAKAVAAKKLTHEQRNILEVIETLKNMGTIESVLSRVPNGNKGIQLFAQAIKNLQGVYDLLPDEALSNVNYVVKTDKETKKFTDEEVMLEWLEERGITPSGYIRAISPVLNNRPRFQQFAGPVFVRPNTLEYAPYTFGTWE